MSADSETTSPDAQPGANILDEIGTTKRSWWQRIARIGWAYTLIVLIVEVVFFAVFAGDRFLTSQNFTLTAQNVAVLTIMASGATFVLITAGVDLSVGSTAIVGEVVASKVIIAMDSSGASAWVGIAVGVVAGVLVGVINGVGIAYLKVPPLIMTLGTLTAALSVAQIITEGVNVPTRVLDDLGNGRIAGVPYLVMLALGVVAVMGVLLHFTVFGRHTYAIGSNAEAARRVGINVETHLVKVYGIAGAMSGLGGVLSLARFNTTSIGGHSTDPLEAIAASALGGTSVFGGIGTIFGTVIGVWIPGVLRNGIIILGVQSYWQGVVIGAVLVGTVWFDQYKRRSGGGS